MAKAKSTTLLSQYLGLLQINSLNLLLFMVWRSPVRICPYSLSRKSDPAQLYGRLSGSAINLSISILETKELKLNILE